MVRYITKLKPFEGHVIHVIYASLSNNTIIPYHKAVDVLLKSLQIIKYESNIYTRTYMYMDCTVQISHCVMEMSY